MIVLNEQCLCEKDNTEYYCNLIEYIISQDSYIVKLSTNDVNKPPIKVCLNHNELGAVMASGHLEYMYDYASRLSKGEALFTVISEISIDTDTIRTFDADKLLKADGLFYYLLFDRDRSGFAGYKNELPDADEVLWYYCDNNACFEILRVKPNEKWKSFTVRIAIKDIQSITHTPSDQYLEELMTPKILQHFVSIREKCAEILARDLGEILY